MARNASRSDSSYTRTPYGFGTSLTPPLVISVPFRTSTHTCRTARPGKKDHPSRPSEQTHPMPPSCARRLGVIGRRWATSHRGGEAGKRRLSAREQSTDTARSASNGRAIPGAIRAIYLATSFSSTPRPALHLRLSREAESSMPPTSLSKPSVRHLRILAEHTL